MKYTLATDEMHEARTTIGIRKKHAQVRGRRGGKSESRGGEGAKEARAPKIGRPGPVPGSTN